MFKFSFLSLITLFLSISVILALPLPSQDGSNSDSTPSNAPSNGVRKQGPPHTPTPPSGPSSPNTVYGHGIETHTRDVAMARPGGFQHRDGYYPTGHRKVEVALHGLKPQNQPSTSQSQPSTSQQPKKGFFGKITDWFKGKFGKGKDKGKGRGKQCRFAFRKLQQG